MTKVQIPAGKTWFDVQTRHFADVPVSAEQEVSTAEFLEATESTTTIFDLLGSAIFTPMKQDMLFNVNRVRERQKLAPEVSSTLQGLVKDELTAKAHNAADGLTWLVRGLDFMVQAFKADMTANKGVAASDRYPKKEVGDLFRESYKLTLAPYHSVVIRPIFRAAMVAAPRRKDFYIRLSGQGTDLELTREGLEKWTAALEPIVAILQAFLASQEIKR
ncbi:hypothetical protein A1O1_09198 [Capronia coronata CBS 617.96]|uniref:Glycolipid transfer protein domain-containing protein n=1 Tax=Capronia coronata CBS 617.96 TaxID=1182541 RepID=W9XP92_9EURO|nr:uncharacterized protein A1O1_09198 [Capronia coronata CBS 617.96]EXJ78796.1 hypothetical protein A1O1_09198 [Capronia coronata CBS 617.96]